MPPSTMAATAKLVDPGLRIKCRHQRWLLQQSSLIPACALNAAINDSGAAEIVL
jgi:hypothetical protein